MHTHMTSCTYKVDHLNPLGHGQLAIRLTARIDQPIPFGRELHLALAKSATHVPSSGSILVQRVREDHNACRNHWEMYRMSR